MPQSVTATAIARGLVLAAGCTACTEAPPARFDAFPLPRPRNLAAVLGEECRLLGPDTLQLLVRYEPRTQLNYFSQVGPADTVPWLTARAFRYRGLYYLVSPAGSDTSACLVQAVRIRTGSVQGLNTAHEQMTDLSRAVQAGAYPELVRYRNLTADSIRLRFQLARLHPFFRQLPDSFAVYRRQLRATAPALPAPAPGPGWTVYPNPARESVTLVFPQAATRTVEVVDAAGRTCTTLRTAAAEPTVPLSALAGGTYRVRVTPVTGPSTSRLLQVLP